MKNTRIWLCVVILAAGCIDHPEGGSDKDKISQILEDQSAAWNVGDLEAFMEGYWKSDSMMFVGSKITYGWDETLDRYRKSYPDKPTMGQLKFTILRLRFLSREVAVVTGRYDLTRENDNPTGIFTLLFKKINGQWKIIHDHTS